MGQQQQKQKQATENTNNDTALQHHIGIALIVHDDLHRTTHLQRLLTKSDDGCNDDVNKMQIISQLNLFNRVCRYLPPQYFHIDHSLEKLSDMNRAIDRFHQPTHVLDVTNPPSSTAGGYQQQQPLLREDPESSLQIPLSKMGKPILS